MKKSEITHYLPVKPISVNECWQGRRFKTKKYDAFIEEMLLQMPQHKPLDGLLEVEIIFGLRSLVRGDLDNLLKPVIDCIVKKHWIADDRYITTIKASKVKQKKESISIMIKQL